MRSVLFGAALAALIALPAAARDDDERPPSDAIVLQLQAEAWVETNTAKVVAIVETVLTGDQAGQQNRRVPPVLNDLAANADWRLVGFDRSRDASGLERIRVVAEARLPDTVVAGIYDRAQKISKPGTQVTVAEVEFQPTLAEREATAAKLRAEIYRRAAEEAGRVAQLLPDRGFRVHRVDFAGAGMPIPRPAPRMAKTFAAPAAEAASAAADAGDGVNVSERMVLTATVVIAAPAPEPRTTPPDGK